MNCSKCAYPIFYGQLYEIAGGKKRNHFPKCPDVVPEKFNIEKQVVTWKVSDGPTTKKKAKALLKRRQKQHPGETFRITLT